MSSPEEEKLMCEMGKAVGQSIEASVSPVRSIIIVVIIVFTLITLLCLGMFGGLLYLNTTKEVKTVVKEIVYKKQPPVIEYVYKKDLVIVPLQDKFVYRYTKPRGKEMCDYYYRDINGYNEYYTQCRIVKNNCSKVLNERDNSQIANSCNKLK